MTFFRVGKRYDEKLISKSMTSSTMIQIITIHILPNISRSKENQAMKFGQLIECITRNIFVEILYTKFDGKTSPKPFSKEQKLSISANLQSEILYSLILLLVQLEDFQNIFKLRW